MPERTLGRAVPILLGAAAICFGSVYPWAYWPLIAGAALVGATGIYAASGRALPKSTGIALLSLGLAIGVQLIPLPRTALRQFAPETHVLLSEYDVAYAASNGTHALSVDPHATAMALTFYVAFALLFAGVAGLLAGSASALRHIVRGIAIVGVCLGAIGVIQKATFNGLVLWFWHPMQWQSTVPGQAFGPFVNRNHFAGWMLMALPLVLGYGVGRSVDGLKRQRPTLRNVIVWCGSPAAADVLLLLAACAGMMLALVLTLSRAGIIGLACAGAAFVAALSTRTRGLVRLLGVAALTMMFLVALRQAGTDTILGRFAEAESSLAARGRIWDVATETASRFWQTGTGLNTFGVMTLLTNAGFRQHFSEAHNDYFQLAAEGGLLVGVPLVGLFVTVLATIRRRMSESASSPDVVARWIRFGSVISLCAIGVQETVDFSLQIPANAALFAVLLAIALHQAPRRGCMNERSTCL